MLHELDTALRSLVERELGDDADVEIDFDAPTKDWASHRNRPTIDIYLYDIRQDLTRSQFGHDRGARRRRRRHRAPPAAEVLPPRLPRHGVDAACRGRAPPAVGADGGVPQARDGAARPARRDRSPTSASAIPLAVALPPPQDRSLSDVWSALGGELKPSLDLILIAPLLPDRFTEAGPPVTHGAARHAGRPPHRTTGETHGGRADAAHDRAEAAGGRRRAAAAGRQPPAEPSRAAARLRTRT